MIDGLTQFILKPAGPFAAGVVLFAVVWGLFKGVESVLNDDTKLEIAVWLLDRKKLSPTFQNWPDTFAKVFDRVVWGEAPFFEVFLPLLLSVLHYFNDTICWEGFQAWR